MGHWVKKEGHWRWRVTGDRDPAAPRNPDARDPSFDGASAARARLGRLLLASGDANALAPAPAVGLNHALHSCEHEDRYGLPRNPCRYFLDKDDAAALSAQIARTTPTRRDLSADVPALPSAPRPDETAPGESVAAVAACPAPAPGGHQPSASPRLEILLTHGSYLGTLAAARYFGRNGHRVIVADHGAKSPTQHSRHAAECLALPDELDFDAIGHWLADFGRRRPGCLLYPCSDDMAWVISAHRDRLAQHFLLLQPPLDTIETLLNKHKLYDLCRQLGIATPETFYPRNAEELMAIVDSLVGCFLVKPKTQIGLAVKNKATIADAGPALLAACREFPKVFRYAEAMSRHDPSLQWPLIQRFHPAASTRTVSVAGFRSRDGQHFQVLSSQKTLQFPIRIGIGLCFASIPVDPKLADSVRRICEATGYHGAFEVEFIPSADGDLLMDFNPRYYGQMQLEISRGLPIPELVACDARWQPFPPLAPARNLRIAHRWQLGVVMTTQALAGRVTWAERRRWLRLTDRRKSSDVVDLLGDPDDRAPWRVSVRRQLLSYLRHPRAAFRALFGNA